MFVIVWTDICVVSINPLCLFVQTMAIINNQYKFVKFLNII